MEQQPNMNTEINQRYTLELCARACGYKYSDLQVIGETGLCLVGEYKVACWNPLTSDGDCARMENMCELVVNCNQGFVSSGYSQSPFEEYFTPGNDAERRRASCLVVARGAGLRLQGA